LADNPLVDYQQETIQNIIPDPRGVSVHTSRKRYRAKKLFNSILPTFQPQPERIYLWQHFAGWEVEFEHDVLEPECIHLMDFQTSQANGPCFFYLLPFTHQKGLVECTVFSEKVWDKTAYEGAIHQYINTHFPDQAFQIRRREFGRIPMTNHRFGTEGHPHIIPIGTAAGLTKPTTGYTFSRIQTDSQQIVAAVSNGTPLTAHRTQGSRYTFYDDLLLYLIHHQPDQISRIFSSLFQRNPIRNILRFLDEDGSLLQDLSLILRLPWRPFLEAIWAYYLRPYRQTFPDFLTSSVSHHEPHTLSH
ncbi:MAG: lycopene cyclase family protein, partial [Bacteroidota bacterium]